MNPGTYHLFIISPGDKAETCYTLCLPYPQALASARDLMQWSPRGSVFTLVEE